MDSAHRIAFGIVVALVAVLLLARTQAVPLIDPDEARFARTSVEMMRSGDLVVPTYEGLPRVVKPPLLHWIQAALFRSLGASEQVARLPAVLATIGSLLILGWIVRRRFGEEGALWAAVFLGTMPLVVAVGRLGTLDALLSVHVLAVVALDLLDPEEAGPYRMAAVGALLGLAFLVKGPVGVIVPLLIVLAGRTAAGRGVVPALRPLLAAVATWFAVVLPWGLAFLLRTGAGSAFGTLRSETLDRYFGGTAHVQPPWFYAPVVLVGFLPWAGPLALGMLRALGRRRDPAANTALYVAGGLLAGLLFFSLGKGKLPNYLLPLAPLGAILVTWELARELDDRDRTLGPTLLAGTLAAFGLVLPIAAARWGDPGIREFALRGGAIWLVGGVVAAVGVLRRRPRWTYGTAGLTSWAFLLLAVTTLMPALTANRSARELVREVPALGSSRPIVVVDMHVPSLIFYLDRVPERVPAARLGPRLERADDPLLVVDPDDLGRIDESVLQRMREIARRGKYRVYAVTGRK